MRELRYASPSLASATHLTLLHCRPVLLVRKAAAKRRETGDKRYYAALERRSQHWTAQIRRVLGRPFKVLFLEPLLLVLTIYMSVRGSILSIWHVSESTAHELILVHLWDPLLVVRRLPDHIRQGSWVEPGRRRLDVPASLLRCHSGYHYRASAPFVSVALRLLTLLLSTFSSSGASIKRFVSGTHHSRLLLRLVSLRQTGEAPFLSSRSFGWVGLVIQLSTSTFQ